MRSNLLKLLFIVTVFTTQAQNTRVETFYSGTKLTFYLDKCGENIPEAQGKLSFCDKINNLGVVEESYGLSSNQVLLMFDNYYNNDEIFLTSRGVSIRKEDNSWENIPHISIHKPGSGASNDPKITNGLLLPDNRMVLLTQSAGQFIYIYDRTTKKMSTLSIPDDRYIYRCVYDPLDDATYFVAGNYNADTFLYKYKNGALSFNSIIGGVSSRIDLRHDRLTMRFKDDKVYFPTMSGLVIHDTKTYVTQKLNSSTTPSILFDEVSDFQFDKDGNIWMSQISKNDGALVKYDLSTDTYVSYQLQNPKGNYNLKFNKLSVDDDGVVWAVSFSYSGIISLSTSTTDVDWILFPKLNFEKPYTYLPNNIYYKNGKIYFTINDVSNGSNNNYEVIIRDGDVWDGINDNVPGNISVRINSRFQTSYADNNGGVWWFNQYDEMLFHRNKDESFDHINTKLTYTLAGVDYDGYGIFMGGDPYGLRKVNFPDSPIYIEGISNITGFYTKGNQIWIYSKPEKKFEVYVDGNLTKTYNLPSDIESFYKFTVDDEDNIWFGRKINEGAVISKFDVNTSEIINDTIPLTFYTIRQLIAAPNNGVWIITSKALIYYENGVRYLFESKDYPSMIYNVVGQCKVDSNGKLYILNNDITSLVTIENPTSDEPVVTKTILEDRYGSNNSLIPLMRHYRASTISIDDQGSVWTHASGNTFKMVDDDLATEYKQTSKPALSTERQPDLGISIYPNPSSSTVFIDSGKNKIRTLELFSISGERITIDLINGHYINISFLQKGIYFIKIQTDNKTYLSKLIKE